MSEVVKIIKLQSGEFMIGEYGEDMASGDVKLKHPMNVFISPAQVPGSNEITTNVTVLPIKSFIIDEVLDINKSHITYVSNVDEQLKNIFDTAKRGPQNIIQPTADEVAQVTTDQKGNTPIITI